MSTHLLKIMSMRKSFSSVIDHRYYFLSPVTTYPKVCYASFTAILLVFPLISNLFHVHYLSSLSATHICPLPFSNSVVVRSSHSHNYFLRVSFIVSYYTDMESVLKHPLHTVQPHRHRSKPSTLDSKPLHFPLMDNSQRADLS